MMRLFICLSVAVVTLLSFFLPPKPRRMSIVGGTTNSTTVTLEMKIA
jgi:hypothetical protein